MAANMEGCQYLGRISANFPAGIEVVWRARRTAAGVGRGGPDHRRRRYRGRSDRTEATAGPADIFCRFLMRNKGKTR